MTSHLSPHLVLLSACLAFASATAQANPAFAPAGTKATLSVDYLYESAGSKRSEGMYDPHEWRVKRTVNLVADLVAQAATVLPSVQPVGDKQVQSIEKRIARCVMTNFIYPKCSDVFRLVPSMQKRGAKS